MNQPTTSQARDELASSKADFMHSMILTAIANEDIVMLRLLLEEPCNTQNLKIYLIITTIHNVAFMREILSHMGPVRDGCVMDSILCTHNIPTDCFDELMRTIMPDLSDQQFLNIVALKNNPIYFGDYAGLILKHLRTITNRRKFPSLICRHLFDGCEIFTEVLYNRYGRSAQHASCDKCTPKASSIWDTEQAEWLLEELKIVVLVDSIYEFAADIPDDFGIDIDQIGYEVARTRPKHVTRRTVRYEPIMQDLLVNPSGDFPEFIQYDESTCLTQTLQRMSIARNYHGTGTDTDIDIKTPSFLSMFNGGHCTNVDVIGWKASIKN